LWSGRDDLDAADVYVNIRLLRRTIFRQMRRGVRGPGCHGGAQQGLRPRWLDPLTLSEGGKPRLVRLPGFLRKDLLRWLTDISIRAEIFTAFRTGEARKAAGRERCK